MNIAIQSGGPLTATPIGPALNSSTGLTAQNGGGSFGDALKSAIGQVGNLEGSAEQQVTSLLQGNSGDMSKVMISVEKADVAFQLMLQVRNKVVSAYQDIEKMQF